MSDSLKRHHCLEPFSEDSATIGSSASAEPAIRVTFDGHREFYNLRGDPADAAFTDAVKSFTGQSIPDKANTLSYRECTTCWLGPDEWLVVYPSFEAGRFEKFSTELDSTDATAVDVSHGYIVLCLSGDSALDLLAKGCTLDLHLSSFNVGDCVQTGIARTAAIIANIAEGDHYEVIVRRTFAEYLAIWMRHAGAEFGIGFD